MLGFHVVLTLLVVVGALAPVARKLDVPDMMMLINKVLIGTNLAELQAKVESVYQVPVAAILPLTPELVQLGSSGLISMRFPELDVSREIKKVADRILAG